MIRRGLWFVMGAVSSVWVQRKARRRLQRYTPPAAVERVRQQGVAAVRSVRAAVDEGREAMREYQADAQAELEADQARRKLRPVREA